jgi:hypothetical protein
MRDYSAAAGAARPGGSRLLTLALALALLLGLGIRLYDLTDLPFDYHPTRQWRGLIIARGIYFRGLAEAPEPQRTLALEAMQREAVIEPPVMETLMAWVFRLVGPEALWGGRLLSAVFWVLGGLGVYGFGRQAGERRGGMLAAIYFLFVPYGMLASRSVQPDALMVALMVGALWSASRWQRKRTPESALLAGLLAGAAIFVKTVAVFMLAGALLGLVLARALASGRRSGRLGDLWSMLRERQIWLVAGLAALPALLYYVYGLFIAGFLRQQLAFRFFPQMWRDPAFYIRWVEMATGIAGFIVVLSGLVGVFLFRERALRGMGVGLWLGYAAYAMTFPYHTITHDYYQLPLIAIASVSMIPLAGALLRAVDGHENRRLVTAVLVAVVAAGVVFKVWDTRVILARRDFRQEAQEWRRFAEIIPADQRVLALTQTYGFPLSFYGWVNADQWPTTADTDLRLLSGQEAAALSDRRFDLLVEHDLFLVTHFNEFEAQADLREYLFANYEILDEGPGYLIFDLSRP